MSKLYKCEVNIFDGITISKYRHINLCNKCFDNNKKEIFEVMKHHNIEIPPFVELSMNPDSLRKLTICIVCESKGYYYLEEDYNNWFQESTYYVKNSRTY